MVIIYLRQFREADAPRISEDEHVVADYGLLVPTQ
jgi:hypothetical protein